VCAYDRDERTVTLALDTESDVETLVATIPSRRRAAFAEAVARNDAERGRPLTGREKLENLATWLAEKKGSSMAEIEGDEIVIRVPISTMQYAACGALEQCCVEVTDDLQAAKGVVRYLNDEDEEGSTLIHFALDKALVLAVENGEEGFSEQVSE
jgi:hypothetical protein